MKEKEPKGLFTCGTPVKVNGKWMTKLADLATFDQKHGPISEETQAKLDKMTEDNLRILREKFPENEKTSSAT